MYLRTNILKALSSEKSKTPQLTTRVAGLLLSTLILTCSDDAWHVVFDTDFSLQKKYERVIRTTLRDIEHPVFIHRDSTIEEKDGNIVGVAKHATIDNEPDTIGFNKHFLTNVLNKMNVSNGLKKSVVAQLTTHEMTHLEGWENTEQPLIATYTMSSWLTTIAHQTNGFGIQLHVENGTSIRLYALEEWATELLTLCTLFNKDVSELTTEHLDSFVGYPHFTRIVHALCLRMWWDSTFLKNLHTTGNLYPLLYAFDKNLSGAVRTLHFLEDESNKLIEEWSDLQSIYRTVNALTMGAAQWKSTSEYEEDDR